jgi:hypothetical protein
MKNSSALIGFAAIAVFAIVNFATAATTISTNIQTDGTLSVTGQSTLTGNVGIATSSSPYTITAGGDIASYTINWSTSNPTVLLDTENLV